jgi:hypothetical protein
MMVNLVLEEKAMQPGPKIKYPIQLLDKEISELRQLVNSRKASQGKVRRAKIILAAHEHPEWSNQEIARQVGCSDRAVRTWRRRWVETTNLEDLPRSGAPKRFSP